MCERLGSKPDLFRIRLPFANLGAGESNCYVLHDAGEWLIVDSGAPGLLNERAFARAFNDLGIDFGACRAMLTHGHFDHAGALGGVLPSSVPLYLAESALSLREPGRQRQVQEAFRRHMVLMGAPFEDVCSYGACNAETVAFPRGRFACHTVSEGDVVSVGSCRFVVLETPGHTADHLCFYEPRRGILFGGDHVLFPTTPSVDAHPDEEDGLDLYLRHLNRIGGLPVRIALFGHGEPVRDGAALTVRAEAIAARKRFRAQAALAFLREREGATGQEVARCVFARLSDASWRATRPMARYYFMLEALVVLRHLRAIGRIERHVAGPDAVSYRPH